MRIQPLRPSSLPELECPTGSARRMGVFEKSTVRAAAAKPLTMLGTVAASLSVVGLNAVQGVILARLLGPAGRGAYSTVVLYTHTLVFIGLFGGRYVFARRAAQAEEGLPLLRNAAFRYGALTGLITLGIVCVLTTVALPAEKRYLLPLCWASACLLPAEHWRVLLLAIDQGSSRFLRFNAGQILNAAALPGLLTLGWLTGFISLAWIVGLTILAPCIGLLICGVAGRQPRLAWSPASPSAAVLAGEGKPYWLAVVADDLFNRLDMLLILWLATLPAQGVYAAAIPAAGLLGSAPGALALFSFNAGAQAEGAVSWRKVWASILGVVGLQALSTALLAWLLKPLVLLVYGSQFQATVPLALALLPANALYGCTQVAEGYLRGRNINRPSIWARLVASSLMVVAALWLWSTWDELAVPIALALGQGIILLVIGAAFFADLRERGLQ